MQSPAANTLPDCTLSKIARTIGLALLLRNRFTRFLRMGLPNGMMGQSLSFEATHSLYASSGTCLLSRAVMGREFGSPRRCSPHM
jgi:hypothetical protein